jgi:hypothetical protein
MKAVNVSVLPDALRLGRPHIIIVRRREG